MLERIDGKIDVQSVTRESCFFAYLDILGFKDIVKQSSLNQLKGIVNDFTIKCADAIDKSRSIGSAKVKLGSSINVRIVSDSIYVWTENDDRLKQFDDLLDIVNAMIASGFQQGLSLRGVVTFGELFLGNIRIPENISLDFSFDIGAVYGRALVEAYTLESQMNWSGVLLTPNAWAKVEDEFEKVKEFKDCTAMRSGNIKLATDLFNHFPHLLWYDIPFKNGKSRKAIAFNWNYKPSVDLSSEIIREAFTKRCNSVDDSVRVKLNETIRFYKYTQRVAELCDHGLTNRLPVPSPDYALSILDNT